jgi:hypothetical protein
MESDRKDAIRMICENRVSKNGDTLSSLKMRRDNARRRWIIAREALDKKRSELIPFEKELESAGQERLNIAARIGIWEREMKEPYSPLD